MSYRILTKNSVDNTNIDGARQNHFNAGMRSGVVKGALNECNVTSPASNKIVINTGELRISGHQIVITESEQMQLTTTPQTATEYSIIAEISVDNLSTPTFRMFIQPKSSGLIQDNLFTTLNGVGTYQIKLANFTQNTDGSISNVIRTAELIGESKVTQSQIDDINTTLENKANKDLANVTVDVIKTEIIYDMSSADSSKNLGYTSGISNGSNLTTISKNVSKYKALIGIFTQEDITSSYGGKFVVFVPLDNYANTDNEYVGTNTVENLYNYYQGQTSYELRMGNIRVNSSKNVIKIGTWTHKQGAGADYTTQVTCLKIVGVY